jgi:hypothetical protein
MIERLSRVRPAWMLAAIMFVSASATTLAMRRTSTTFDEIVLIAAGARGFTNGKFDLAPDHPPFMQYVYGLPVYLSGAKYPAETGPAKPDQKFRYNYARAFFWDVGNDPQRVAFLGRLPAVLCALLLVFVTFAFARTVMGQHAALLAAALVAFLPDVLAHGGVAYNDVPLTMIFFIAVWALDRMARQPGWRSALAAGAAVGLALGIKVSAIALGPAAVALLVLELVRRGRDPRWIVQATGAVVMSVLAAYFTLVVIYRGDFGLSQFSYAIWSTFHHVTEGHGAGAYLLGKSSARGFWYFFPLVFFFKTSAALHLLGLVAAIALLKVEYPSLRELAGHPLRVPVVAAAVFGAALLTSSLNIGFRYALPILPHICVLIAAGVAYTWRLGNGRMRAGIVVLSAWAIIAPLTYYPNFLAYISEYGHGRGRGREIVVDSSLDWGQGLLQLNEYLRAHGIPRVYLSYFGSAKPDGYGIDYEPLFSFGPLLPSRLAKPNAAQPQYVVISATNLAGVYFNGDPFARFRAIEPDAVVAQTMYVYRIRP